MKKMQILGTLLGMLLKSIMILKKKRLIRIISFHIIYYREQVAELTNEVKLELKATKVSSRNNRGKVFEDASDAVLEKQFTGGRNSMGNEIESNPIQEEVVCSSPFGEDEIKEEMIRIQEIDECIGLWGNEDNKLNLEEIMEGVKIQVEEPLAKEYASNNYWRVEPNYGNAKELSLDYQ